MASDDLPQPDPRGAMVPPASPPPTAIGTGTPEPPRPPRPPQRTGHVHVHVERTINFGPDLKLIMNKVLDAVDQVAETIAVELGIRPARSRPSSSEPPAP